MSQILNIKKDGVIRGGHVAIRLDSPVVVCSGEIKYKIGWSNKKHKFATQQSVDLKYIKSNFYKMNGNVFQMDGLKLKVERVAGDTSFCAFMHDEGIYGEITVDTSSEFVRILSAKAKADWHGLRFSIKLTA